MTKLWKAHAVYTGGGIWLFYGKLEDGNFFLMDDDGGVAILNADPSDLDESLYDEWLTTHLIEELEGEELTAFQDAVLGEVVRSGDGGFTPEDADRYHEDWNPIEDRITEIARMVVQMVEDICGTTDTEYLTRQLADEIRGREHSMMRYMFEILADNYERR